MMNLVAMLEHALASTLKSLCAGSAGGAVELIGGGARALPEEEALVVGAVEARRQEFRAGRRCAQRALATVGGPLCPIMSGALREPVWPTGYSGSISHDGRIAAAVAYRAPLGLPWLSVDIIDRMDAAAYLEVIDTITDPQEPWSRLGDSRLAVRVFSAKEAAVKIVSPHVGDFVEFARLRASEIDGGYQVTLADVGISVSVRTLELDGVVVSLGRME